MPYFQSGTVFEHIDFGINPVEQHASQRADWFEDARVRQAFLLCTDRQRIVDDLFFGRAEIIHAYVPSIHPLFPDDAALWPYDVAAANELLDSAGFLDTDDDGVREDPGLGGPFKVSLLSPIGNANAEQIANILSENLADQVVLTVTPLILGGFRGVSHLGEIRDPFISSLQNTEYEKIQDNLIIWGHIKSNYS